MFEMLLELAAQRKANNFDVREVFNHEMKLRPTAFDTPKQEERKTYTY